jgi:hypothetical protein
VCRVQVFVEGFIVKLFVDKDVIFFDKVEVTFFFNLIVIVERIHLRMVAYITDAVSRAQ